MLCEAPREGTNTVLRRRHVPFDLQCLHDATSKTKDSCPKLCKSAQIPLQPALHAELSKTLDVFGLRTAAELITLLESCSTSNSGTYCK